MRNYSLKGFYSWEIVENGVVVNSEPTHNNLILSQGIDYVAQRSFVENILYCAIGEGSSPPILSDTGLSGEVDRTGNVDDEVATPCITQLTGNVYSLTKTFKFGVRASPVNIGTIGWSYSSSSGNNLFSKALIIKNGLPDVITLGVGQYLRVRYTLQITISPASAQVGDANITELAAPGQYMIQRIGLRSITSNGSLSYYDAGNDCNEPSAQSEVFLSTNSTTLASFGSSANRSSGTNYVSAALNSYSGNGVLYKQAAFGKGSAASSTLRSMGVGVTGSSTINSGWVFLFDSNQTKSTNRILLLKFVYSWSS